MRDPSFQRTETAEMKPPGAEEASHDVTRDVRNFTATIRNRIFSFLRGLINHDYETALRHIDGTEVASPAIGNDREWSPGRLEQEMKQYHLEHQRLCLDPEARNQRHTYVVPSEDKKTWRVQQMLVDPDQHNDWVAEFEVDLGTSRQKGEPAMRLVRLEALGR
jgi:hypothetical protein